MTKFLIVISGAMVTALAFQVIITAWLSYTILL